MTNYTEDEEEFDTQELLDTNDYPDGLTVNYKQVITADVTYKVDDNTTLKISRTSTGLSLTYKRQLKSSDYYGNKRAKSETVRISAEHVPAFLKLIEAYLDSENG